MIVTVKTEPKNEDELEKQIASLAELEKKHPNVVVNVEVALKN